MLHSLLDHYIFTHETRWMFDAGADLVAATVDRRNECKKRSRQLAQDILTCVGVETDQSYIHDLVYGLHKLYDQVGTPLRAAMQGIEHVNKQMKDILRLMVCAGGKGKTSDISQMSQIMRIKSHVISQRCASLPADKYSQMIQGKVSWQNMPQLIESPAPAASPPRAHKSFTDSLKSSSDTLRLNLAPAPSNHTLPVPRQSSRRRRPAGSEESQSVPGSEERSLV